MTLHTVGCFVVSFAAYFQSDVPSCEVRFEVSGATCTTGAETRQKCSVRPDGVFWSGFSRAVGLPYSTFKILLIEWTYQRCFTLELTDGPRS